ncbi:MAG TPA: hypothetical protein VNS80_09840, partial [Pseudolysinimonas sp.]|nr:hypothetical protein [Pseudolysinimonas sp.]
TPLTPTLAPTAIDERGEIWALQYPFSLDEGPLSTHAPGDHGFSTVNCYLIRDKSDSLLIDTGFTTHRDALVADVTSLVSKDGALSLFPLRFGEFNSICNIVPLVELMNGGTLYSSALGDARAAVPFHPRDTPFGTPNVPPALANVELATGRPGTPVTVGSKELESLEPPLQLLPFHWLYEPTSKTLFTCDVFAYRWNPAESGEWSVTRADDMADDDFVYEHLIHTRFWWLAGANIERILAAVTELFDALDIETIAPGFGRILRGADVVHAHVEQLKRLITRAGADVSMGVDAGQLSIRA